MNGYLVWRDDDKKRPMKQKIADGILAAPRRLGRAPNVLLVHPDNLDEATSAGLIEVKKKADALKFDFWLGVE
jgi:hypothetical protein